MWSKKPTPVSRTPAPVPSRASVKRTSVSPVVRRIVAPRALGGVRATASFLPGRGAGGRLGGPRERPRAARGLHGRGVARKPLRAGEGDARRCQLAGRVADPDLGHPAPEVAGRKRR